jgi:pyrimidine operon attenuation protein / uracil phosphoribosyltransferase
MTKQVTLISNELLNIMIQRLCKQLIENHKDFSNSILIGLQPRGAFLSERLCSELRKNGFSINEGVVDPTFYRDDFRIHDKPLVAKKTHLPHSIDGMKVVLIDDVLYTGRTIRAGMECLMEYGRPKSVELLVLIDRKKGREIPIEANYVGKEVESFNNERVKVLWKSEGAKSDHVIFLNE